MDIHKNARLTLILRAELVKVVLEEGFTLKRAAARILRNISYTLLGFLRGFIEFRNQILECIPIDAHLLPEPNGARRVNAGMDILQLKELMGHSSIATTLQYAQLGDTTLAHGYHAAIEYVNG